MNKRFLISRACFALILLNIGIATAQENLKNSLGISFGGSNVHILDMHASKLIFSGTGIAPSVEYTRTHNKNRHILDASFYYGKLYASSDNFKNKLLGGHIRYGYLRSLVAGNRSDSRYDISAGLSLSSFFMNSDYYFYLRTFWAGVIQSWYGSYSADFAAQFDYQWRERDGIRLSFFMPVISNVSRPEYSSSGDFNYEKNDWQIKVFGNTKLFPDNLVFNTRFSYEHCFSNKFSFEAEYEFYYSRCENSELIRFYMNNVRLGILYNF